MNYSRCRRVGHEGMGSSEQEGTSWTGTLIAVEQRTRNISQPQAPKPARTKYIQIVHVSSHSMLPDDY